MINAAAVAFCFLMLATTASQAKTWKGKWDDQSTSTMEFQPGNRVKFCIEQKCVIRSCTGSEKGAVAFQWSASRGSAHLSFEWNGSGYDGRRFGLNGPSSTIQMK